MQIFEDVDCDSDWDLPPYEQNAGELSQQHGSGSDRVARLPCYEDSTTIGISVSEAYLFSPTDSEDIQGPKSAPHLTKRENPRRSSWRALLTQSPKPISTRILVMTRGDYYRYWARDARGNYNGSEPEGEGRRIWRKKLMREQEYDEQRRQRGGERVFGRGGVERRPGGDTLIFTNRDRAREE